jgi:PPOX class probable F420-dependent enzyme
MSPERLDAFLRGTPRNAILGTTRADGYPQVTPVWFWWEDGVVRFELGESRVHYRNLRRDPRATVLVEADYRIERGWQAGAQGVMFSGPVDVIEDERVRARYSELMADHYFGADATDPDFLAAVDDERFFHCILRPERTVSWDWTPRA